MKKEYDFSKGERGKFFKENLTLNIPIYLEPEIREAIEQIAKKKKTNAQDLINLLIKNSIQLYKSMI